jgi:hypothetical protein
LIEQGLCSFIIGADDFNTPAIASVV